MRLHFTNRSHLNSAYVNDSGQVLYKVETPNKYFNRVATIKRLLPGNLHSLSEATGTSDHRSSDEAENDDDLVKSDAEYEEISDEEEEEDDDIQEAERGNDEIRFGDFGHLAEITFNPVAPAVLQFGGQEHQSTQFFTKKAFGWYGSSRAFTGPDGIEYEWIFKREVSELVRVDSEQDTTLIARYRRRQLGVFSKPRPASLEIFSEGMHIIDLIVITFVYIQKLRNDKKGSRDR